LRRAYCSNACRQTAYRHREQVKRKPVEALVRGNNADLIREVAKLYVKDGMKIADVTFGKGAFWRKTPHLDVTGSDLITVPSRPFDFRALPYQDDAFDVVVLDPPYIHSPGKHQTDHRYQNAATTKGLLHDGIMQLYGDGMREAMRVSYGQVWVKCKDQVQSGVQRWAHIEIMGLALAMGMTARDMFILDAVSRTPMGRWDVQHHARKPMSYLWVFDVA